MDTFYKYSRIFIGKLRVLKNYIGKNITYYKKRVRGCINKMLNDPKKPRMASREMRKMTHTLSIQRKPIYIILDNVWDTINIGAVFRVADATGACKLLLCRETATPPNLKITKGSVGACNVVDWEYYANTTDAIASLRNIPGMSIYSLEQDTKSIPYTKATPKYPYALILGNETHGVSKEALAMSDYILEIPMNGLCNSMNVTSASAVTLFHLENVVQKV